MNRKISLGIAISIAAIACAVTFVITMTVSLNNYNGKIADVAQRGEINTKLQEMDAFIRNYSLYEVNDDAMKEGVYSGYLNGLDDTGANYYSTDEYYYKKQIETGRLIGLGMEFEREEGGYIRVRSVYDGSPAFVQGIAEGDVVISVGGVSVLESGYDAATEQLRYGDEGTKVRIVVRRSGEETEYELLRAAFDIPTVEGTMLDNGIFYIRIFSINTATGEKFGKVFSSVEEGAAAGYVIDLRGCRSGVYTPVSGILAHFIGEGQIASAVYRNNSTRVVAEIEGGVFTNLPISIIIDEKTGGSAELIAEALRDHAGAVTVGENSSGYGTIQETKIFSDGTAVEISVAMVTPSAENGAYNGQGIAPEFAVEYDGAYEKEVVSYQSSEDAQFRKAIEVILSKSAAVAAANGENTSENAQ